MSLSIGSLLGKVAVVTGGSKGIGAACALEFAKHGVSVLLHGRNENDLCQVAEDCERLNKHESGIPKVAIVSGDLELERTVHDIVDTTRQTFGKLDILFNNAGFKHPTDDVIHMGGTIDAMDAMYRVNIRAAYLLSQNFVPDLTETKGTIINCSTTACHFILPRLTGYNVAKAGLDYFTKNLALSLVNKGIRVNSINPGYVRTDILRRVVGDEIGNYWYKKMASLTPLGRKLTSPEEVAAVVAFLASDMARAMTGQLVVVDRGAVITNPMVEWQEYD